MNNKLQIIAHSFHMGWQRAWTQKAMLFGFLLFYAVLTSVWASVWFMVPEETMNRIGLNYSQVVWYFMFTELMMFSVGHLCREIEDDVRGGQMTMFFVRPISYVLLKGSEWLGYSCARALFLFPFVLVFAFCITREFIFNVTTLIVLPFMITSGLLIWVLLQIVIGLTAAWFNSVRPINMIFQKTAFVLGGLVVPITHYPEILQTVSWVTPFPAILFAPASLVITNDWFHIMTMIQLQLLWIVLCLFLVTIMRFGFEQRLLTKGEL